MNDKLTLQELIDLLAARHQMEPQDADAFVKEFWALIEEGLKSDNYVKIKGLGTFKLIDTEARESINVQTGERIEIQSHARVTFSPEASLRDLINRPFAHFETVVLNDATNVEAFDEVDARAAETIIEDERDDDEGALGSEDELVTDVTAEMESSHEAELPNDAEPSAEVESSHEEELPIEEEQPALEQPSDGLSKHDHATTLYQGGVIEEEQPAVEEEVVIERHTDSEWKSMAPSTVNEQDTIEQNIVNPTIVEDKTAEEQPKLEEQLSPEEHQLSQNNQLSELDQSPSVQETLVEHKRLEEPLMPEDMPISEGEQTAEDLPISDERDSCEKRPVFDEKEESVPLEKTESQNVKETPQVSESQEELAAQDRFAHQHTAQKQEVVEGAASTQNSMEQQTQDLIAIAAAAQKQQMEQESFCRKSKRHLSWCVVTCSLLVGFVIGGFAMLYFLFANSQISENFVHSLSHEDNKVIRVEPSDAVKVTPEKLTETLATDSIEMMAEVKSSEQRVEEEVAPAEKVAAVTAPDGNKSAALHQQQQKQSQLHQDPQQKRQQLQQPKQVQEHKQKNSIRKEEPKTAKETPTKQYLSDKVQYKIVGTIATHKLRNGETLTRIALKFYGNKKIWPYIVRHNKDIIKNPDNVPIGTTVRVPKLVPITPGI